MATIKSYTDLEQSKKLAEILPPESADMYYSKYNTIYANTLYGSCDIQYFNIHEYIPCWSLAALLDTFPKGEHKDIDLCFGGYQGNKYIPEWYCSYEQQEPFIIEICYADNPVDACYKIILHLHEQKIL